MNASGAVGWHDRIAEEFDQGYRRSPAFIERLAVWERLIERYIGGDDEVLDAGCGAGIFSFVAARRARAVTAFDGSPKMIALCRRHQAELGLSNIEFTPAMLESVSTMQPGRFDAVLCSSVLEYTDDLDAELARLAYVLKPGGRLIVSMPNAASLYRKIERLTFRLTRRPRYFAHVRFVVSRADLERRLAAAGLDGVDAAYFADPPLPGAVLGLFGGEARRKSLFALVAVKRG